MHCILSLVIVIFFLRLQDDNNYLYLYRISYMYYIVLGFLVTFIVALIFSAIFKESHCNNPDLFTPFVAKRLKKHGLLLKIKSTKMVNFEITLHYFLSLKLYNFYRNKEFMLKRIIIYAVKINILKHCLE